MFESVIISHEMERGLKEDVCRAMMAQVHRYDHRLGRFDNSGHETYARVKQCLDGVSDAIKPMDKTLSHVWEQVCSADETVLAAFLREMLTEAEHACVRILCLGAMITRGLNTLAGEDGEPLGQASMEDIQPPDLETEEVKVDEATGEIVDGCDWVKEEGNGLSDG